MSHAIKRLPNGGTLATLGDGTTVETTSEGVRIQTNKDGARVVTGSGDETVRIWDAVTGALVRMLEVHDGDVNCCAFSPDGSRVVTASSDGAVCIGALDK